MSIEVIEIKDVETPNEIQINTPKSSQPSVNFGLGVEMLMNDKKKDNTPKQSNYDEIKLDELNELEKELNNLDTEPPPVNNDLKSENFPSFKETKFSFQSEKPRVQLVEQMQKEVPSPKKESTWDGFQNFNKEIPEFKKPESSRDLLREKFEILRKLEHLESNGVRLSKKYSMESNLDEMKGEYTMIMEEKEKSNSIKFQGKMLMAMITGMEFLNNKFDPFDIKLDGWAESINENIDDYDEIFGELHKKYRSKAKMAPELKLLFQLGGSAIMLHMTNTMFKSSLPGMDDIMRQNPELMQQFTQAAVNTMGKSNEGFGNFMNDIQTNTKPAPQKSVQETFNQTKSDRHANIPPIRSTRPDIGMSRGKQQFDDAYDISNQFESVFKDRATDKPDSSKQMKGPKNIADLLSGIKTKPTKPELPTDNDDVKSTISLQEYKSLQVKNNKAPKSSKRSRSEKNTVSLDI